MTTARLLEQKATTPTEKPPDAAEQKLHPAIIALEKFYASHTLIDAIELYMKEDIQGELNFWTRLDVLSSSEMKTLSHWTKDKFPNAENSPDLTRREKTWLGHPLCIGIR